MIYKRKVNKDLLDFFESRSIFLLKGAYHKEKSLSIGDFVYFFDNLEMYPYSSIMEGNSLFNIGSYSYSRSSFGVSSDRNNNPLISIGRYSSVADNVRVFQGDHSIDKFTTSTFIYSYPSYRHEQKHIKNRTNHKASEGENVLFSMESRFLAENYAPTASKPVIVGHDVWIGSHVALRPGIVVGNGACIATGSVVTKDVPPYAIVAGNPAKIIKYRFKDDIIENLIKLNWYNYDFLDFHFDAKIPIERFIDEVNILIDEVKIKPLDLMPVTAKDLLNIGD